MKHMIGFTCWNKCDMILWLIESVVNHFPAGSHVTFFFDGCTDDSIPIFRALRGYWLDQKGYVVHELSSETEKLPLYGETKIKECFMETDCDILHILQDDQHLNAPIHSHVENLIAAESSKHKIGVIGGRDGYTWGYQNFVGSRWSESTVTSRISPGVWAARPYVNPNPLIFSRQLIKEIGYYDPEFHTFYHWDDYCKRATNAGFTNFLLGTDLTHVKFGRISPSWAAGRSDMAAHDIALLRRKHPEGL